MKTKSVWLWAFLFSFVLSIQAADNVNGNGKLTTKSIKVDDFNEIRIDGIMDFNYAQSEADANDLAITVDENLHQYIKIDIHDRVLTVGFDKKVNVVKLTKFIVKTNSKWLKKVRVAGNANFMVQTPLSGDELEVKANENCLVQFLKPVEVGVLKLDVAGSANMVVETMKVDKLDCNMNGSGSIRLKAGSANQGDYTTNGSGDIHAFGVAIPDVKCKMAGSGLSEVQSTGNLNASLVGKGTIRYKAHEGINVQQRILGKGTIEEVKE